MNQSLIAVAPTIYTSFPVPGPSSQSSVTFPSEAASYQPAVGTHANIRRQSHLPLAFRRISLPTPTGASPYRHSVASVASFGSLPEEGSEVGSSVAGNLGSTTVSTDIHGAHNATLGTKNSNARTRHHKSSLTSSSTSLLFSASTTAIGPDGTRRKLIENPSDANAGRNRDRSGARGRRKVKSSKSATGCDRIMGSPSEAKKPSRVYREAREQKRRKIIQEFYDTEKTYVVGLDFIYHHFLSPLIASLEMADPVLGRTALNHLFSNFIDIWNLHKSFFDELAEHLLPMLTPPPPLSTGTTMPESAEHAPTSLGPATQPTTPASPPPHLSPILLSHFPYLSLYTPFITAFPSILSTLTDLTTPPTFSNPNPNYSKSFSEFLVKQEAHPKCGKLKFRDWMLTIVQRCPRYLLLLKDLRRCMGPVGSVSVGKDEREREDEEEVGEYERLGRVLDLVSKITSSLNTSLQTHAQTLSLISLQRSTSNLPASPPFQFVLPGRTLLKRESLYQIERSEPPKERVFLLFSDCLVWLARSGGELEETLEALSEWGWGRGASSSVTGIGGSEPLANLYGNGNRNRSMSDAHLPLSSRGRRDNNDRREMPESTPSSPQKSRFPISSRSRPFQIQLKRHSMAAIPTNGSVGGDRNRNRTRSTDERWVYKGRVDLVNVEVVVASEWGGEQRKFEVLGPEGSFSLYAATEHDRDEWVNTIRQAKAQLLVSLNVTNPNSTLTSSASTNHVRRTLQALPFPPAASSVSLVDGNDKDSNSYSTGIQQGLGTIDTQNSSRRAKVEHWVPAIWIPDEKTRECMRCGQPFGWRRRRHHCRLCGRCVCARCSEKTFYIADLSTRENDKDSPSKPARACNICYETVFPVLGPEVDDDEHLIETRGKGRNDSNLNSGSKLDVDASSNSHNWDTITSLSNFSAWVSMPSLPMTTGNTDLIPSMPSTPKALMGIDFERAPNERMLGDGHGNRRSGRVRLRSLASVNVNASLGPNLGLKPRPMSYVQVSERFGRRGSREMTVGGGGFLDEEQPRDSPSATQAVNREGDRQKPPQPKPIESTMRKRKRFSLPAIALHPLNVTARTIPVSPGGGPGNGGNVSAAHRTEGTREMIGERTLGVTSPKRFSLVLGSRNASQSNVSVGLGEAGDSGGVERGASVVMGKLSELLLKSSKRRVD
ncbi:hypothetical protein AX15_002230 [Amanita polypyramis BW_CC]|nr:hypothetical protein AX15_002230 [Amanita polypyramis BW_CC]